MTFRARAPLATGLAVVAAVLGIAPIACGPSFQSVYEADARFEHCYAVDLSEDAGPPERSDCWRDWIRHYTAGQTRDRVEHASARLYALTTQPSDEPVSRPEGQLSRRKISAPMPTSLHEAPPNLMPEKDGGAQASAASTEAALSPQAVECVGACASSWQGCRRTCKAKACDVCDRSHRLCSVACVAEPKR